MRRRATAIAALLALGAALAIVAGAYARPERAAAPAADAGSAAASVKCGKTRTIGFMAPVTGPAASIGIQQVHWAQYYVATYNKTHKTKFKLQTEDTQLGAPTGTAEALKGAQALAGSSNVLGVVGPAGSNEIVGVTKSLKDAGLAWVSGSSTRTSLTTDGTRTGYMFRTVPPDAVQGTTAANFILNKLKYKRVYIIDDQESYSTGLADAVEARLKAAGATVSRDGVSQQQSDFSSLIAKIARDTQIVYIPWQLPPKGQAFGNQMKAAGKGTIKLMGADGLYDSSFAGVGAHVYDTNFPLNPKSKIIAGFKKGHGGDGEYFGAPTYAATQVIATAIDRACKKGSATRASVRAAIRSTNIPAAKSLIGVALRFNRNGDLSTLHKFGLYKSNGKDFVPIAG
ncbi:MAG TPA: branched-chain amino acid ABC transporter substrate-binding protein [Gaiellaceae bacterium]|nr:branched-chain amino acid ABC transporter substrate-binding protein [Gaiellaceae bacterium]